VKKSITVLSAVTAAMFATSAWAGTLEDVQKRGTLSCGVSVGLPGFSLQDEKGNWTGIDVDTCRAVAAAVLGDAKKVRFVPLTAKERFTALQSGEIDMLSRNTTWTHTRDTSLGLNFAGVNYYDGQGFLVQKNLGVKSALELDGASVCIQAGTTTELNLADYFRLNGMKYSAVVFDTSDQTREGFESARCDILTSDQSQLYAIRSKLGDPNSAVVMPEVISKEPLGPSVAQGDDQWADLVRWSLMAMVEAEELGVNSENVDDMKKSENPSIQRLLGVSPGMGEALGVDEEWAYRIIKQVGNYGESYKANVTAKLGLERGLNALWTDGGLQYAMPVR
jgi:general L-amino acid transport system substrate-binding protein